MKNFLLWAALLPLSYFAVFFFSPDPPLRNWLDGLFLIGLLLLIVGCVMVVIAGGFFNAFIRNWKTFFSSLNRKDQVIQDIEGKRKSNDFQKEFRFSGLLIKAGLGYCVVSLVLSVVFI